MRISAWGPRSRMEFHAVGRSGASGDSQCPLLLPPQEGHPCRLSGMKRQLADAKRSVQAAPLGRTIGANPRPTFLDLAVAAASRSHTATAVRCSHLFILVFPLGGDDRLDSSRCELNSGRNAFRPALKLAL